MSMRKLIPIVVLTLAVALVAYSQFQAGGLEKYLEDINQNLDYVAVVRVDNFTTLVLKEENHYLVVEEPDASGIWSLFNGTGKTVRWTICGRGGQNNGTQEILGPIVFMNYLLPVLNGSPLYDRNVTWGNPIEVTLVRKPGVPPYENVTINDTKYGPQTLQIPVNDWIRANLTVSDGRLKKAVITSRYPDYFNFSTSTVRVEIEIVYRGEKDYEKLKARVVERYTELLRACPGEPSINWLT
ncbi:conserved exported protein of unknown function [Thermococcus nautili]|uniref:hypothetical protein n=1 Tax=Thermococcus nautili TaxID=195522 RepID=UPI0025577B3F|nr:hypothetical protein [Thermococcus nautili]CAI1492985.1 conserved exported protein of unknown function [Thermococcus nautili]